MASHAAAPDAVFSVSELTQALRDLVGMQFGEVWVRGEVSRVVYHGSGHVYLTLKDADAVLNAAIWRSTAGRLRYRVEQGQEVLVLGGLDVYAPRGSYQLIVRRIEPVGEGALRLAFEQLRRRLEAEGLFDDATKRQPPAFPRRIALVTSRTGAAIRDLVTVIQRRLPSVTLVLVPVRVQGEGAGEEIARALAFADAHADADVMVVGRGGGSLEDLWAFNEEVVGRAIHACRTPVVSAVGHESDVTISDLVADVRAATPSQAGELVVPAREDLQRRLDGEARRLERALRRGVDLAWQRLEGLGERPVLREPLRLVRRRAERLDALAARVEARSPLARVRGRGEALSALETRLLPPLARRLRLARARQDDLARHMGAGLARALETKRARLAALHASLRALAPLRVLGRGYALALREDGRIVRRGQDVQPGERLVTRVADGSRIVSRVEEVRTKEDDTP